MHRRFSTEGNTWRGHRQRHHHAPGAPIFLTWHLRDAVPQALQFEVRNLLARLHADLLRYPMAARASAETSARRAIHRRLERELDLGYGRCELRIPEIADIVADVFRGNDPQRATMEAWCVMPNHVHLIVWVPEEQDLRSRIRWWKSRSAMLANEKLGREGRFWCDDYYDVTIRDERHLERVRRYVVENPASAGLTDWRWVWSRTAVLQR